METFAPQPEPEAMADFAESLGASFKQIRL
jgi:hypothetical protein